METYVLIKDLLENGAKECKILEKKPNVRNVGRYITIIEDEDGNCGRGEVSCSFNRKIITSHFIFPHENSVGLNAFVQWLTIGDLEKCAEWLLARNITG